VKLEGGRKRLDMVTALIDAEVPVMGHIGLTPQSVHMFGGLNRVQAKSVSAARELLDDADALADAGCFAIVLEGIPAEVAQLVTERVRVPTIGIGAGPHCDGQVLVMHDLLGLEDRIRPRFVRRYADLKAEATAAVTRYVADVRAGTFPNHDESYHADAEVIDQLVPGPQETRIPIPVIGAVQPGYR
jgi:3-methyl-2-oxobutanoate hydroxymethyltransferase